MTSTHPHQQDFNSAAVSRLRADLAVALRAAAQHGLSEGVCNHFSVELPDGSGRFLLNPRGLLWREVGADDIVMVDGDGQPLAGRHPVEPTAMHIHAAIHRISGKACDLTGHQFDLLVVLAQGAGRVLSRDQIMDALKGHAVEAFDRSIDVHVSRIRACIEDDPKCPKRVLTVRGSGYVFARKQDADE